MIWKWLETIMDVFGLSKKKGKIIFVGLDNSGKTTLLHMLRDDHLAQHVPTLHPTCEEMSLDGINLTAYDLGGHQQARRVWREYFPAVNGIIFIVDSADWERIEENKTELQELLKDESIASIPVLILGNKIDKFNALSEDQLKRALEIEYLCSGKNKTTRRELNCRPLEVFMCSIINKQGYASGIRWLADFLDS